MEEFIKQGEGLKAEVLGWTVKQIPDGGHVREITLIADKIERGISLESTDRLSSYFFYARLTHRRVILYSILSKSHSRVYSEYHRRRCDPPRNF
jgi:hypothetical protein